MRKLTYFVATTIDGFIAGPNGGDPTGLFLGEGDHMDALFTEYPDIIPVHVRDMLGIAPENKVFDTVLEGRPTYELGLAAGVANAYPHLRHYVFSRTLGESPAPGVEVIASDPVAKVRELKAEDGKRIWLCGGATIAGILRDEIDELIVKQHPLVFGSGVPLFTADFRPQRFDTADVRIFQSGVIHTTYVKPT